MTSENILKWEDLVSPTMTPDEYLENYGNKVKKVYDNYQPKSDVLDKITNKKFFLWVHFVDPHAPYTPPKSYSENFMGDEFFKYETLKFESGKIFDHIGNSSNLYSYIARYDGEISFVDYYVQKLLDKLDLLK